MEEIRTVRRLRRTDRLEALSAQYRVPVCMIMRANGFLHAGDFGHCRELFIPRICYCRRRARRAHFPADTV